MKKSPRYALFSVYDKTGLIPFAKELSKLGFQLIASGGTAEALQKARLKVIPVEKITGFPSMLGGRVKTLHPLIHGGILWRRDNADDQKTVAKYRIPSIDIVVVNLYPFEAVASRPNATHEEIVENIDIGGPTLIRSTAKNYESTAIVVNPERFDAIIDALKDNNGKIPLEVREALALEAFRHTERYDTLITRYFANRRDEGPFPTRLLLPMEKIADLRYGENPHQRAALYRNERKLVKRESTIVRAKQLHGKELSFNNYMDLNASWDIASSFAEPAVAIIKHNNPCGVAVAKKLSLAYKKALEADKVSAFGGIVAANRSIDRDTAKQITQMFMECVIAPGYAPAALSILKKKKNLRIMQMPETPKADKERISLRLGAYDYKKISGGFLVQESDTAELSVSDLRVVTKREPTLGELQDLFFAFTVAKYVKSNAIVIVKNGQTVGLGVGQTNRVGAVDIALHCAKGKAQGAVMASDGFFPFGDSVALARKAGIRAIIQPGGSVRDDESIAEANKGKIAMVFTGRRHFRH